MTKIACYCRVSTDEQHLARQVRSTLSYARDRLDADTGAGDDAVIVDYIENEQTPDTPVEAGEVTVYYDRSTGTDTERDGYQELLATVSEADVDAVVVHSVSRVSRSIRDLDRTAEQIVEESDTELHIISEGFELLPERSDPFQQAMFQLLGVFAELEAKLAQQRSREGLQARLESEDYHHGQPPLGFTKENGQLFEASNYYQICSTLSLVVDGQLSKRKAAEQLGTSRRTINRAIQERPELYGLED